MRGRWTKCTSGISAAMAGRMVELPSSSVSLRAAHVQQPVGEDMAAPRIGAKLDLVDGHEIGADASGMASAVADPILHAVGDDAFLAGDQRHHGWTARLDDAVIDLARQKAQRQPDDASAMAQHPRDGLMRLAGVRGAQNGGDPSARHHVHCLDIGTKCLAFQTCHAIDRFLLVGVDRQALTICGQGAVILAHFLQHAAQLGQRLELSGLQFKRACQSAMAGPNSPAAA